MLLAPANLALSHDPDIRLNHIRYLFENNSTFTKTKLSIKRKMVELKWRLRWTIFDGICDKNETTDWYPDFYLLEYVNNGNLRGGAGVRWLFDDNETATTTIMS